MSRRRVQIERRVTPWVNVESRPEWAGSDIAAYRIWLEFDGLRWFQCHEWERRSGNRRRFAEAWILAPRGWSPHMIPTTDEPPDEE